MEREGEWQDGKRIKWTSGVDGENDAFEDTKHKAA